MSRPIYEAMPKLYIGAGILNIAVLDSPLKYPSAALLIGAGILVMLWRRQARSRASRPGPSAPRAGVHGRPSRI